MPLKFSFKSSNLEKFNIASLLIIFLVLPSFVFTSFKAIDSNTHQKVLGVSSVSLDPTGDNSEIVDKTLDVGNSKVNENSNSIKFIIFSGSFTLGVSIFLVTLLMNHLKKNALLKKEVA